MTNAAHRLLWTVLALVLVTVGATGLALSLGGIPAWTRGAAAWPPAALVAGGTPWLPLGGALAGLALALLGQRLIGARCADRAGHSPRPAAPRRTAVGPG
jgi:hypothetical protein